MLEWLLLALFENLVQLLDLYNCDDWGCGWVEFLEVFAEIMSETVGNWQMEEIDEEGDCDD